MEEPYYYLGNDYKKDKRSWCCIGCNKYLTEAICCIESMFGDLPKNNTPIWYGDHPKVDNSIHMNDEEHHIYQMIIGILNWLVCLGRIDIWFTVSSLSHLSGFPRYGHLDQVLRVFGYLKKNNDWWVVVDSSYPILVVCVYTLEKDHIDWIKWGDKLMK